MTMRVRVTTGSGPPSEFALDGDEVLIGRAATSRIVLNDAKVSRQHARLVRRDDAWWVEDLGARNRTRLNGAPVQQAERLHAGDRLEVGDALLRVIDEGPATEATSAGPADAARMWTINEIHRALSGPLSLAELLDVMLARCFDVLDPEEGLILLRSADGALAPMASRRRGPNNAPVTVPRRLVDEVAGKAQPALVLDAAYDDRFSGSASMVAR